MNVQVKELEANVLATAPDKKKQKLLEENVNAFKTGMFIETDLFLFLLFLMFEIFKNCSLSFKNSESLLCLRFLLSNSQRVIK